MTDRSRNVRSEPRLAMLALTASGDEGPAPDEDEAGPRPTTRAQT